VTARKFDHVIVGGGIAGLWLARTLSSRGRSVALVERGARHAGDEGAAQPPLRFPERVNVGATQARRHVLTGNGSVWGGALVRNDPESLRVMFDVGSDDEDLDRLLASYEIVERRLAAPATRRFTLPAVPHAPSVCEFSVLPGRRRNVAKMMLDACAGDDRVALFCPAEVVGLDLGPDGRLGALTVRDARGTDVALRGEHVVLAMGVVDANIFARTRFSAAIDVPRCRSGTRLHDHWSIPVAKLRWKRGAGLDWLYPPTFRNGCIQGRRAELSVDLPWGRRAGFVHLQAQYDLVEPYATIKRWMNARQEGRPWMQQAAFVLPLVRHAGLLARLGWSRYLERRLFVADGMELNVVLDFESFPSERNRIEIEAGGPSLYWDVREQDVTAYRALAFEALVRMTSWAETRGLDFETLVDVGDAAALERDLRTRATDAYHLGGGLAVGRAPDWRFHRVRNLGVIGTAAFARPGIANPVATILAMCESYARRLG
jgi:hypothetical protein